MTDTFSKFGYSFQIKLIAALFKDRLFLQQISDILNPAFMESEANQWIVQSILDYFVEFGTLPTLEVMKVKLNDVEGDVLKTTIVDNLKQITKQSDAPDIEFIEKEALDFCKNQTLKTAIMESVNLLQQGESPRPRRRRAHNWNHWHAQDARDTGAACPSTLLFHHHPCQVERRPPPRQHIWASRLGSGTACMRGAVNTGNRSDRSPTS